MPSGAKKRKAAKKKKEKEAYIINGDRKNSSLINDSNKNSQGNDGLKSQDERESDCGEVGSPSSQDNHQSTFSEGNEDSEKRDPLTDQSFVPESKQKEIENAEGSNKVMQDDDATDVATERIYSEEDTESKVVPVEHIRSKESHDENGSSSSSSSSSSDDETRAFEKKWDDKAHSLNLDANSCYKEQNAVVFFSEEGTKISENEKPLKETNSDAVDETSPIVDSFTPAVPMSVVMERVMEGSQVENTEVLDVVEQGPLVNEVIGISALLPQKIDNKVYPILNEDDGGFLNVIGSAINVNEGKILMPEVCTTETSADAENINSSRTYDDIVNRNESDVPKSSDSWIPESSTDAENTKGSETHEATEEQPLLAPAPRAAQRTSWMSCCGLFDVLTGTDR